MAYPVRSPRIISTPPSPRTSSQRRYDNRTLDEKYCSCVFQVTGKTQAQGYPGNPYAICTASIYNRRGIRGPGSSIRCDYPDSYLQGRTAQELYNYAVAKDLIVPKAGYRREDLIRVISEYKAREFGY